jgi:6-phosphogluconolactonase
MVNNASLPDQVPTEYWMYVGTYTGYPGRHGKGIYAFRFLSSTGELAEAGLVAETPNPSFLVIHPSGNFLYAVNEGPAEDESMGMVSAFSVDRKTGQLHLLNQQASQGDAPAHLALDHTGRWLIVANYTGGSLASFPVKDNGGLGDAVAVIRHSGSSVRADRQSGPHPHQAVISPDNRFVLIPDLGLDQVRVYRLDLSSGTLHPDNAATAAVEPGSGPRHLAFHPNGRFVFLINELTSTIAVFDYDAATGLLTERQTDPALPKGFTGTSIAAEIATDRTGKVLYASNRGSDDLAILTIDAAQGTLSAVAHVSTRGKSPRHFAIDPTGQYLFAANQESNNIVQFRIDTGTGELRPTGTVLDLPSPVCVAFHDASGRS